MKRLLLLSAFVSSMASAQLSMQETDSGSNRLRVFGSTWSSNMFSLASAETDKFNDDGGRISTYNYVSFATWLKNDYRFALRVPFQYNTAGTDRFNGAKQNKQEIFLQDLIVGLQKYDLALLPWDLGLYWEGRFYLPTSKNSQEGGLITRYRNEFILSKVFSRRWEINYDQKFSYYVQSRTAAPNNFIDENGFEVNATKATKRSELDHWFVGWYKFTPQTALGWMVGAEESTYNRSAAENKDKPVERKWKTGPQLRFPLTDRTNFILVYADKVDSAENRGEFGKFLAKNTEITLLSFIGF